MVSRYIFLFLAFCSLTGCAPERKAQTPQRILSLSTAATHILTELEVPPCAIDEYGRIAAGSPPPAVIGKGTAVSREKIAELGVDGVILWYYQEEAAERFRNEGLPVTVIPAVRLAEYPELILRLGEVTGKTERAQELAEAFRGRLERISVPAKVPARRVCFELYSPGKIAGDASYLGDLVRVAGGKSIVSKTGLISAEAVVEAAPDVIFYIEGFGSAAEIAARSTIYEVTKWHFTGSHGMRSMILQPFTTGDAPSAAPFAATNCGAGKTAVPDSPNRSRNTFFPSMK